MQWFPIIRKLRDADTVEEREALINDIVEGLALLEEAYLKISEGKDYFGGDTIGYVDIVLGSMLGWVKVSQIVAQVELLDPGKAPGLAKWAERFCSHDVVKDILPEPSKLLDLYLQMKSFPKTSKK